MVIETEIKRYLRIASLYPECGLILLFMDADEDCVKELAELLKPWLASECRNISSELIVIPREYEAWIISGLESLRGQRGISPTANSCATSEQVRDAKGYISREMVGGAKYHETSDQSALTSQVDLDLVRQRCPSFKRLIEKIESHVLLS